jgi:hypothetical protein
MASPETPLLTAIALSDCWSAGWLLLRSASDWQPPAEITDELCGKYGWLGRRAAMRRIAGELSGNADPNLRRAAKLLAADPADADACREIAEMLTEELYRHNLTDAAADAIKGWGALARGLGDAAEPDPIKAGGVLDGRPPSEGSLIGQARCGSLLYRTAALNKQSRGC